MLYYLFIQRKPLYYLVNIVVPAFIITALSIIGFFAPQNAQGDRQEKVKISLPNVDRNCTIAQLKIEKYFELGYTGTHHIAVYGRYSINGIVFSTKICKGVPITG